MVGLMVENENENVNGESISEEKNELKFESEINEVSSCERHIKITIPRKEVTRYFDKECKTLQDTAIVPGFRKGKAPRKLIEKKFKEDIQDKVKSALMIDSYSKVNDSDDITPISEPSLDIEKIVIPAEGDFIYEYDIEVRPTFDLPNWKGMKLQKTIRNFNDDDVNEAIERIRQNNSDLVDSDDPAKPDDYIAAKLTFSYDGAVLSSSENEIIRIRPVLTFHDSTIRDFDKLMTGAKPGDIINTKTILSIDAPNPILAGKEIEASFEIKKVMKQNVPELDKDFLLALGGFNDLADLKDAVLDMLKRQYEYEQDQDIRKQITKSLLINANWTLPPVLLRRQAEREVQRTILELRRNGYDDRQINVLINKIRQNSLEVTEQALKEHFILEKIAEVEGIEETQEDYDRELTLIALQSNESLRKVRARIENAGNMDILRNQIIERKVLEAIQEEATQTEVPYQPKEKVNKDNEEALDISVTIKPEEEEEKKEEASEEKTA